MKNHENNIYKFKIDELNKIYDVKVVLSTYASGSTALLLKSYDNEFHYWEDFLIASVFLEGFSESLPKNQVFIKDYSENSGVLNWLQKNEIVGSVLGKVNNTFVDYYLVEIL